MVAARSYPCPHPNMLCIPSDCALMVLELRLSAMGALHKQTTYDIFGKTTTPEQAAADMEAMAKEVLDK